jgi:transposase-like protein
MEPISTDEAATNNEQGHPDPEVVVRPRRRHFTAKYKLSILKQADACTTAGGVGKLLRQEGLYSSHLSTWRRERDQGALAALGRKRGPTPTGSTPVQAENERLRREVEQLKARLQKAELIIDVQKKVSLLLGVAPSPSAQENS